MKCEVCGRRLRSGTRLCLNCGAKMPVASRSARDGAPAGDRRFDPLHVATILCLSATVSLALAFAVYGDMDVPHKGARMIGHASIGFALMAGLAMLVSIPLEGRARYVAVVAAVLLLGGLQIRNLGTIRDVVARGEAARADEERDLPVPRRESNPTRARVGGALDALKAKAARLGGRPKALLEALVPVHEKILDLSSAFAEAEKRFESLRIDDLPTVRSRTQLDEAKRLLGEAEAAHETLFDFLENADAHVESALSTLNPSGAETAEAIRGFRRSAKLDEVVALARAQRDHLEATSDMIALLTREWGAWQTRDDGLAFDRFGAYGDYNDILARIEESGAEWQRLRARMRSR